MTETIKIVVVDDHPVFREGLSRLLQQESDLEVVSTLADGEEALNSAVSQNPDVIIMDISMPKMNGIEATKQIKTQCPEISVLMMTAYNYHSYQSAALKAGADGYLLKNTPLSEIIETIRLAYSRRHTKLQT